jgi:hypothetical protein
MVFQAGVAMNLLENYRTVTVATARAKAHTYMFQEARMAHESHNLFMCLEASLSSEARIAFYSDTSTYTLRLGDVLGEVVGRDQEKKRRDGLMLFMGHHQSIHIDDNGNHIRLVGTTQQLDRCHAGGQP